MGNQDSNFDAAFAHGNDHSDEDLGAVYLREYPCRTCGKLNSIVRQLPLTEADMDLEILENSFYVQVVFTGRATSQHYEQLDRNMIQAGFEKTMSAPDRTFCLPRGFYYFCGSEHTSCVFERAWQAAKFWKQASVLVIEGSNAVMKGFESF